MYSLIAQLRGIGAGSARSGVICGVRFVSSGESCIRIASTAPKKLNCIKYPGLTSYKDAAAIQEDYVERFLASKRESTNEEDGPHKVRPTLLMFQMSPVYTCGRRQVGKLNDREKEFLTSPLPPNGERAEFVEAQRGGQLTFHGPGQLVVYPILDLAKFGIRVKCYVRILEDSIIDTLAACGIKGFTTEDTGVWVSHKEKIAAIGIHVRRSITSHGLALNINNDKAWFDRIVACGLPDKSATTMAHQGVDVSIDEVADLFAEKLAKRLEVEEIKKIKGVVPYYEER